MIKCNITGTLILKKYYINQTVKTVDINILKIFLKQAYYLLWLTFGKK